MSVNRTERRRRERAGTPPSTTPWARWAIAGATLLLLAAVVAIAVFNRKQVPQSASEAPIYATLKVGDPAPPFAVTTIDGRPIDSNALRGPILLEVFATWCPHCQHETALLNALQRRFGKNLSIVAVSGSDTGADRSSPETLDDVRAFAQYFHVEYPVAYDGSLSVAKQYLQGGFPTIVFITSAKRIAGFGAGEVPFKKLVEGANKAGAQLPRAPAT